MKGVMVMNEKLMFLCVAAVFAGCATNDAYDIRPDADGDTTPTAVKWQDANDARLAAATAPDVLARFVTSPEAADALLAKIGPAYLGDPFVLTQIESVTQYVIDPRQPKDAEARVTWVAALERTRLATNDDYVRTFCEQQLWQCRPDVRIDPSRIGVCSWSWHSPLDKAAEGMRKLKVKGVHLSLRPFISSDGRHGGAETAEVFSRIKERIARGEWVLMSTAIGMKGEDYTSLQTIRETGGIVPDNTWEDNKQTVSKGAQLTRELGCGFMSTHAGFLNVSDPVAFKKYVERVTWMRDECAKYGVTLILESGQETADDLSVFMKKVPGIGINFDPANMILYAKGRPLEAVKKLYPWIRQVHVKDAVRTKVPGTWGREMPWGAGEVGGKAFLSELEALGYKGNYVIEREGGKNRVAEIGQAYRALVE